MAESTKNHVHIPILDREPPDLDNQAMEMLETAVLNQDVMEFQSLVNDISWSSQSPSNFEKAIHMALALEAPLIARRLAEQGVKYYPTDPELKRIAHILAPPIVTPVSPPIQLGVKANKHWIKTNQEEYKRKWVALDNGELIASAQSFSKLIEKVGDIKGKGILVTQVT
jgi:hypothetical protein